MFLFYLVNERDRVNLQFRSSRKMSKYAYFNVK